MGTPRVRFNAECDLLLLEQAVACEVYKQGSGKGWKQVATNLVNSHPKFLQITPRCARERTHLLVTKYAAEMGQPFSSTNTLEERELKAVLLNQLLHKKQGVANGGLQSYDEYQPKIEFASRCLTYDIGLPPDVPTEDSTNSNDDTSVVTMTNGGSHLDMQMTPFVETSPNSPKSRKRKAAKPAKRDLNGAFLDGRGEVENERDYLVQLVNCLEETGQKRARLLEEEMELKRRELEITTQRLHMEINEKTALVNLMKVFIEKI